VTTALNSRTIPKGRSRRNDISGRRGRWWRFAAVLVITALVLYPISLTLVTPFVGSRGAPFSLEGIFGVFTQSPALEWLGNSIAVSVTTVIIAVLVGAPGGYVLSRARNRVVSAYALVIFTMQSMPVILMIIPLFLLLAGVGLVDSLAGLTIIYVGCTVSFAVWMMAGYIDTIPRSLEEAAWLDGASVMSGFFRVVLRNSLPGVLSTAIFCFLFAWNDYLIVLVFIKTTSSYTLGYAIAGAHSPALTLVMLLPPILIFALLNRYFSFGGVAGSLSDR
jgi:multiple sugar transport system permease protein